MRNLKLWTHSLVILLLALTLRVLKMALESPGIEEIFAILVAQRPLNGYLSAPYVDFCPPLLYALFRPVILQGGSILVLRLISIIAGSVTCVVLYHAGRTLFDHKIGALAGYLLAVNPLHIFLSQEAQSIALFGLVLVVAFVFLIRSAEQMRRADWIAFDVSLLLMMHAQREAPFVGAIFLLLHLTYVLFYVQNDAKQQSQRGARLRIVFFNYAIVTASSVPWLFSAPHKVPWFVDTPGWRDLLDAAFRAPLFGIVSPGQWLVIGGIVLLVALLPPFIRILQDLDFRATAIVVLTVLGILLPFGYSFIETPRFSPVHHAAIIAPFFVLTLALFIARCNLYVRTALILVFMILFVRVTIKQASDVQKTSWTRARDVIEEHAPANSLLVFWPDYAVPIGDYFFGSKYELTGATDFFTKWAELPQNSNVYFIVGQYPSKTAHIHTFGGALSQYARSRVLWQDRLNRVIESRNLNRVNLGLWYNEPKKLNIVDTPTSETQFLFTADKPEFRNAKYFHVDRPDVNYDSRGRRIVWTKTDHVELRPKVTLAPGNYVLKLHCTPILEQPEFGQVHQRSVTVEVRTGVESKRVQLEGEHTIRLFFPTETELSELPVNIDVSRMLKVNEPVPAKYGVGIYSVGIDQVAEGF